MSTRHVHGRARSRLTLFTVALAGVALAELAIGPATAHASGVRTIGGKQCLVALYTQFAYCSYSADETFTASGNTWTWADYHVSGSAGSGTNVAACFTHYTNFSFNCAAPTAVSGTGTKDVGFTGFSQFFNPTYNASEWDYFYVELSWDGTTPSAGFDAIYGIGYTD